EKKAVAAKGPEKKVDPAEKQKLVDEACEKLADDKCWVADAQFNAGLWWEGLGKSEKAITAYQRYIARFKDKKDVPEIAYNIGLIYEKDKKWQDAVKVWEAWQTTYAKDTRVTPGKLYDAKYKEYLAQKTLKGDTDRIQKDLIANYAKLSAEEQKKDSVMTAYANM